MHNKYEGHTPGPWQYAKSGDIFYVQSRGVRHPNADGLTWHDVATLSYINGCTEGDAALIADAPELLRQRDALLAALAQIADQPELEPLAWSVDADKWPNWAEPRDIARAAIALTKGGA
jgi:hypothetical protein